jgi:DNA polymerase-3 subunit gamma/tau
MQYQVLARKWRPQSFRDIVGQEHVSRTLLNALQSGRVAHAFLFSGPRGSGKTTTARILAKALNCHEAKPGEPCGRCPACTEVAAGNCIDVLEIDAASNTGVDNVRELIEQVRYRPARDRHKIFIIDEVHMLSNAAFNALLKTLEEPPSHVVFIMATTEYHKIPATILSRCQQYSFKLIKYPLILDRLRFIAGEEKIQISKAALELVVFSSGGSMRDAMSALDQVLAFSGSDVRDEDVTMLLGLVEPAVLGATVRAIAANDTEKLLRIVADMAEAGQDLENFCRRLLAQFRNLMVLKAGVSEPDLLGVPESLLPELREQAALFSREDLLRLFDAFLKVGIDLKQTTQVRFELEMGLIELAHISRLRSLEDLISDFTSLVRGESTERPPARPATGTVAPPAAQRGMDVPEMPPARSKTVAASRDDVLPMPAEPEPPRETGDPARNLLLKIAAHVHKESLESNLQSLAGAVLQDGVVVLNPGAGSEFLRRQVRENLPLIAEAASEVLGRLVQVRLGSDASRPATGSSTAAAPEAPSAAPSDAGPAASTPLDPLDRARREPVVQSFLDVFPGPVKAEDLK